jgi:hypothetical protein
MEKFKIISGLEHCLQGFACVTCPYYGEYDCQFKLSNEAIEAIKSCMEKNEN